ncbi:DUF3253 domain-containing protein [Novosphingobium guangzhouense]|uniref:DUF3253 domain-containing protein n=2 Tax=Novosphingobium TaxID=165696 RepID=UPI000CCBE67D|nr:MULTISPECIES: DUF3253 domain-containing protein [Novosphingobium]
MTPDARKTILQLLGERMAGATICPSEVARAVASEDHWREAMPAVHAAVDEMIADGIISLSWKGRDLDRRSGAYRIRLR